MTALERMLEIESKPLLFFFFFLTALDLSCHMWDFGCGMWDLVFRSWNNMKYCFRRVFK